MVSEDGPARRRDLAAASEQQRQEAMTRLSVLRPHIEGGVPLPRAAAQAGVALRTAERWLSAYRQHGLAGADQESPSRPGPTAGTCPADRSHRGLIPAASGTLSVATVHRNAAAIAEQNGWAPPSYVTVRSIIEGLEDLDLLLLTVPRARVVHRDGIRLEGMRYLDVNLAAFVGEPVIVRYDPRDLSQIRVFHHDTFLCTAVCPELADVTISLKDLQTARNRCRRELRAEITDRRSLIDELLAVHQVPEPPPPPRPGRRLKRYRDD